MMNGIFLFFIVSAVAFAAVTGRMPAVNQAGLEAAKTAVTLALGLVGQMALWLGFMRVVRDAGLMAGLSRALHPLARRLFPEIPADHPALGAVLMNLAANMLGLTNAATPFGLKAMRELEKLNPRPGVATNAMALFLAINTSGVAVLPLGMIALRAQLGARDVAGITLPSILATMCSTTVAIIVAISLSRLPRFAADRHLGNEAAPAPADLEKEIKGLDDAEKLAAMETSTPWSRRLVLLGFLLVLAYGVFDTARTAPAESSAFDITKGVLSDWLLPVLMAFIVLLGFGRRVRVYESFVAGAKEGFDVAVMIIPYLVAILVAVGMFRAAGLLELLVSVVDPLTSLVGLPAEALPVALIRPLSGSGAFGVISEVMKTHGPDSFVGFLVSVLNGSTETTFYVLALYFGSVGVRATRHTVFACLAADMTGVLAALFFARIFFSG